MNNNKEHINFYTVLKSNNIVDFQKLFNDSKILNSEELDEILSEIYNKALLNNIELSSDMSLVVKEKLLQLRFFNEDQLQQNKYQLSMDHLKLFSDQLLKNIDLLNAYFEKESFLYIALSIAKHVRILKRSLRSTYDKLPWEEIEFCLVTYVASNKRLLKDSDFYKFIFTKSQLLQHVKTFGDHFKEQKDFIFQQDIKDLIKSVPETREVVVNAIILNFPSFEPLYQDYSQIRNFFSLTIIDSNINFILNSAFDNIEGHLVASRALQMIGEYMKTSLESPNLSTAICTRLFSSLSKNTVEIIINLRDSISHYKALGKRLDIEEKSEICVNGIQKDLKKISAVISDILCDMKIQWTVLFFNKIIECKEVEEITCKLPSSIFPFLNTESLKHHTNDTLDCLEKLIDCLNSTIKRKTYKVKNLFRQMKKKIASEKKMLRTTSAHILRADYIFKNISNSLFACGIGSKDLNLVKLKTFKALNILAFPQLKSHLNELTSLALKALDTVENKLPQYQINDVRNLIWKIFYAVEFDARKVEWIEELRDVCRNKSEVLGNNKLCKEEFQKQLQSRLNLLTSIHCEKLSSKGSVQNLLTYRDSKKLQMIFEIILLDIMSILDRAKKLTDNPQFIVSNSPLLIGKCLRNFLAHGDDLLNALSAGAFKDILLNVNFLITEYNLDDPRKIGKMILSNPLKLDIQCQKDLFTLNMQEKLFKALADGNQESINLSLSEGADINSRSSCLKTSLHFASMGTNIQTVIFVLNLGICPSSKDSYGHTSLHVAAAFGRSNIVEHFLKHQLIPVNENDMYLQTPLHLAAQKGHSDVIKLLLAHGADFCQHDNNGSSPLYQSVINNHDNAVILLLEKEPDLNLKENFNDFTLLHIASEKGNFKLVHELLNKKANVNAKTDRLYTPLHAAAKGGNSEIINALIDRGAEVNAKCVCGFTPLFYAAMYAGKTVINQLVRRGSFLDIVDKFHISSPLIMAIEYNNIEAVEQLLQEGAKPGIDNYFGMIPFHFAAAMGHNYLTNLLMNDNTINEVDNNSFTALHFSAMNGHLEIVKILVEKKATINALDINQKTPLHLASEKGYETIVKYLLDMGASVDLKDVTFMTALHLSALHQHKEVTKLLILHGSNVYATGLIGITPFHIALGTGSREIIEIFIAGGANLDSNIFRDLTPLHLGILNGNEKIVEYIFKNTINNLFQASTSGITVLHLAVEANQKVLIKFLIDKGFDIKAKDKNGCTALHYAVKKNYKDIVSELVSNATFSYEENGEPLTTAVLSGFDDIVKILLQIVPFNINTVVNANKETLLHLAARNGHKRIVELLLTLQSPQIICNVDARSKTGHTPLHLSAMEGHTRVVEMLLKKGASCYARITNNSSPVVLAVKNGHFEVLKLLIQHDELVVHEVDEYERSLLHIAAQGGKLDIVIFFLERGANIDALDCIGFKPVHLAALHGHKDVLEHFLHLKPMFKNEVSIFGHGLLHFAADKCHLNVTKFLIQQKIDVNMVTDAMKTPLHLSLKNNKIEYVKLLLDNGAYYNAVDKQGRKPRDCISDKNRGLDAFFQLVVTELLFDATKNNKAADVKYALENKAFVNARETNGCIPLHYASSKGFTDIVIMLLEHGANPNIANNKGLFPLHFASHNNNLDIVKVLLSKGAIYNPQSNNGKIPFDFSKNDVADLLNSIDIIFRKVQSNDIELLNYLERNNILSIFECLRKTKNREGKSLKCVGLINSFSENEKLRQKLMSDAEKKHEEFLKKIKECVIHEKYKQSLQDFQDRDKYWFLSDSDILQIKEQIGIILVEQHCFNKALKMFQDVLLEQEEIPGFNPKDTLKTRMYIAIVKLKQNRNFAALKDFQDIFMKQKGILGTEHEDVLQTQCYLSLALGMVENFIEALKINSEVFKNISKKFGKKHQMLLLIQHDRATILSKQGKYNEAFEILQNLTNIHVQEFGLQPFNLRTKRDMGISLHFQGKDSDALKVLRNVLENQKLVLEEGHFDVLITHNFIGDILYSQNKIFAALDIYKQYIDKRKKCLGLHHPDVLNTIQKMEHIECVMLLENHSISMTVLQHHLINNNLSSTSNRQGSYSRSSSTSSSDYSNEKIFSAGEKEQMNSFYDDSGISFIMQHLKLYSFLQMNLFYNSAEEQEFGIIPGDPMRRILKSFSMFVHKHKVLIGLDRDYQIFKFIQLVNEVNAKCNKQKISVTYGLV